VSSLERLGWNSFFQEQVIAEVAQFRMARVIEEQRGLCRVAGDFDGWAEVSGRFRHEASSAADFPAVGDWVGIAAEPGAERAVIHCRLERRSAVSRKAAGRAIEEQVLAANVDTIFLVTALTDDLNPRRIERYLTMVWEAGAMPVVVLNKADLCEDPSTAAAAMRARLPFVDVLAVSALDTAGLNELTPYLRRATTIALLGSSGVGKSTLVNRLLGRDLQRVADVREADGKGRHTTTSRQLVELAGGALLIDTPGMRELQPWVDESAIDGAFEDIAQLARGVGSPTVLMTKSQSVRCSKRSEPADSTRVGLSTTVGCCARQHSRSGSVISLPRPKKSAGGSGLTKAMKALYRHRDRW
jgi:ribosome biogenesis GTPase